MIELPEARTIAKELRNSILGKQIINVGGNYTDHKFTFYYGDPSQYKQMLVGKKVTNIIDRNYYVEIEMENYKLIMRDGANIRYYTAEQKVPDKSKLLLTFEDSSFLNVTTSMYSFICVFDRNLDMEDPYYTIELNRIGALDKNFTLEYFKTLLTPDTLKLSIKGFLATEQRILGIGNGVVQDIMFYAQLHPKRKMNTLTQAQIEKLYSSIISTLQDMVAKNGRDTEKDIYGESGNYKTILSNLNYKNGCPLCHSTINKEQFLGGSIYYCPECQK